MEPTDSAQVLIFLVPKHDQGFSALWLVIIDYVPEPANPTCIDGHEQFGHRLNYVWNGKNHKSDFPGCQRQAGESVRLVSFVCRILAGKLIESGRDSHPHTEVSAHSLSVSIPCGTETHLASATLGTTVSIRLALIKVLRLPVYREARTRSRAVRYPYQQTHDS